MPWGRLSQARVQPSAPGPYRCRALSISLSRALEAGIRTRDSLAFSGWRGEGERHRERWGRETQGERDKGVRDEGERHRERDKEREIRE